ncbi:hypothetical protein CVT26_015549 [Gymnopilus dilepis]|uniref:Uncharacterized protein n=1 Tax=Gymnopilus dilepis TaxID=231916 RepID=A0A409YD82_9AGAR|nr:hypothetical protein CVT26_015549 [Gymnopilus dilepis]
MAEEEPKVLDQHNRQRGQWLEGRTYQYISSSPQRMTHLHQKDPIPHEKDAPLHIGALNRRSVSGGKRDRREIDERLWFG